MVARQRSIFDFRKSKEEIYIDLTGDDDPEDVIVANKSEHELHLNTTNGKNEEEKKLEMPKLECIEIDSTIQTETESVNCPICSVNMDDLVVDQRMEHVNQCLQKLDIKEELEQQPIPKKSNKRKQSNSQPRSRVVPENVKYVNKLQDEGATDKLIKVPTTIKRNSGKKLPIPIVKILTFDAGHSVAVDAFCYAPHDSIDQYFLTHFHADHYGGISKNWCYERVFQSDEISDENYKHIIYCTPITGKLLTLRFSIDPRFIVPLELNRTYMVKDYINKTQHPPLLIEDTSNPGLYVTPITANHCPGAAIFLFQSISLDLISTYTLHCGDFRVNREILEHPKLIPFHVNSGTKTLNRVYLDTTYMDPAYNFPKQETVCTEVSNMFVDLLEDEQDDSKAKSLFTTWFGNLHQSRITDFLTSRSSDNPKKKKFLILVGTYLIGKENLAIAILKRLKCPIYVSNINSRDDKVQILKTYGDDYLDEVLTNSDIGQGSEASCVIHLVPMQIAGNLTELSKYFNHNKYHAAFERCVGLRPTGWTFQGGGGGHYRPKETAPLQQHELFQILKEIPTYSFMDNILPQAPSLDGKNPRARPNKRPDSALYRIYSLPYSEHSSFRELSYFAVLLNIENLIPTVNISNEISIQKMNDLIKTWETARSEIETMTKHLSIDDF